MTEPLRSSELLPADADFGLHGHRPGPIGAADFEAWPQEDERPLELIEGWVLPLSPGTFKTGELLPRLFMALWPLVEERGWRMSQDSRHRLPAPPGTVVFPDLAIHAAGEVETVAGSETVSRVPDLVVELLSEETFERDLAPNGARFLAYQMSGVREYYHAWPDGREAAGFLLREGVYVPLEQGPEGFFSSPLLGRSLRLVEPAVR